MSPGMFPGVNPTGADVMPPSRIETNVDSKQTVRNLLLYYSQEPSSSLLLSSLDMIHPEVQGCLAHKKHSPP